MEEGGCPLALVSLMKGKVLKWKRRLGISGADVANAEQQGPATNRMILWGGLYG